MSAAQGGCGCSSGVMGPSLAYTCGPGPFVMFMGLLETFIRSQCDIMDPCGRVRSGLRSVPEYDFVVVGGGSGGAVAAARLADVSNWRVLLIEAGGDEPPGSSVPSMVVNYWGSDIDWGFKTEPESQACLGYPERRCTWVRGKVLGGCSVLNGMMYLRGTPKDYDRWAAAGNTGWSYKDVLPYFIRDEDNLEFGAPLHGKGGPITVQRFPHQPPMAQDILEAGRELGYPVTDDLNCPPHLGFAVAQTTSRDGSRLSSARAFLRSHKNRMNLDVILNATVTKILIDNITKTAYGVEYMLNGQKLTVRAKKEVVVAGGAVNSPQILLLSGIGPRKELEAVGVPVVHDLPGVGRNLHNHVAFFINFVLRNTTAKVDLDWAAAMTYMLNRTGPMSSTGLSQLTARLNSKYADPAGDDPDIQFFFGGYLANCARTGKVGDLADPDNPDAEARISVSPVVLHPRSRGYLKLRSNDPLAHPLIFGNYLVERQDMDTMLDAVDIALKLGQTALLTDKYNLELESTPVVQCANLTFNTHEYWECAIRAFTGPENHQAGSCKMGPDNDPHAVVDPQLRVRGIRNLRVMDASVMPVVVSGNTAATVMMIAEKGVDMIKKRWKQSSLPPGPFVPNLRMQLDEEDAVGFSATGFVGQHPRGSWSHSGHVGGRHVPVLMTPTSPRRFGTPLQQRMGSAPTLLSGSGGPVQNLWGTPTGASRPYLWWKGSGKSY